MSPGARADGGRKKKGERAVCPLAFLLCKPSGIAAPVYQTPAVIFFYKLEILTVPFLIFF
jgi:hypothetical protein